MQNLKTGIITLKAIKKKYKGDRKRYSTSLKFNGRIKEQYSEPTHSYPDSQYCNEVRDFLF